MRGGGAKIGCTLQCTLCNIGGGGVGRAKTVMRRWGYLDDAQSVDCDCGEPQTMAHLLSCRLLDEACMADDLATVTERAMACARKWETIV